MSEKSPGTEYSEKQGSLAVSRQPTSVTTMIVSSRKGPVDTPVLVRTVSQLIQDFGDYSEPEYFKTFAPIVHHLETLGPVYVVRVSRPSFQFASTEFPSNEQIVGFRIDGPTVAIEGESITFAVYSQTALGNEIDVTNSASYSLRTPSLGSIIPGVFTAGTTLGTAIIDIDIDGNLLTYTVDIEVLQVTSIQIIGPASVVSGETNQFRAIAYFINDTAQDVTFDPQCTWTPIAGTVTNFNVGSIVAETVSVDDLTTMRVIFKGFSEDFNIQVVPTYFELISAGESVFGIGNFNANLEPEYDGLVHSHTVEWEITSGSNGSIDDVNLLETTFRMNAGASDFFLLTLFIDRGTINEQSANVSMSKGALTQATTDYSTGFDWVSILQDQSRWQVPGSLSAVPDLYIGPQSITDHHEVSVVQLIVYSQGTYSLLWQVNPIEGVSVDFVQIQRYSSGWNTIATVAESGSLSSLVNGFYRVKVFYSNPKYSQDSRVMSSDALLHKPTVLNQIGSEASLQYTMNKDSDSVTNYNQYPKQILEFPIIEDQASATILLVPMSTLQDYDVYPKVLVDLGTRNSTATASERISKKSDVSNMTFYVISIV